jgi:hypothetical protein
MQTVELLFFYLYKGKELEADLELSESPTQSIINHSR